MQKRGGGGGFVEQFYYVKDDLLLLHLTNKDMLYLLQVYKHFYLQIVTLLRLTYDKMEKNINAD